MKAGEIMTRKVSTVSPEDTVANAALVMARVNAGILPVLSGKRMVGLVTDRDIVVRAIAAGKPVANCTVDDVMTEEVHYCLDDDTVDDVAARMGDLGVRRMPVLDRNNTLVGMISLDDIAAQVQWEHVVADALRKIAKFSRAPQSA
jgi:CBS domain-containing protein